MSTSGEALQRGSGILMPGTYSSSRHNAQQQQPDDMPLPMKNNLILQRQKAAIYAFQQRVIEERLRQSGAESSAPVQHQTMHGGSPPPNCDEDDAAMPSTRYAHMSDILQPERSQQQFDQWYRTMKKEADDLRERVLKDSKQGEQQDERRWEEQQRGSQKQS